jgi:hypothetical protein
MEENICMLWVYVGVETSKWKKIRYFYFLFLEILTDERIIFISLSFRMIEIDFDVDFIMRSINFLLTDTSYLIILYTNIKNYDF